MTVYPLIPFSPLPPPSPHLQAPCGCLCPLSSFPFQLHFPLPTSGGHSAFYLWVSLYLSTTHFWFTGIWVSGGSGPFAAFNCFIVGKVVDYQEKCKVIHDHGRGKSHVRCFSWLPALHGKSQFPLYLWIHFSVPLLYINLCFFDFSFKLVVTSYSFLHK